MKVLPVIAAVFGFLAVNALQAADPAKPARANVIFDHPEKFKDIKDAFQPTEKGQAAILEQIREFIVHEANYFIPEGYHLTMTFTDIDLAGDFEPWLGDQWQDVRIVKPIYPPELKFEWVVTDPRGQVVRHGKEDILDVGFDWRITANSNDSLHFEKDILTEWMRNHLGDLKATVSQR